MSRNLLFKKINNESGRYVHFAYRQICQERFQLNGSKRCVISHGGEITSKIIRSFKSFNGSRLRFPLLKRKIQKP